MNYAFIIILSGSDMYSYLAEHFGNNGSSAGSVHVLKRCVQASDVFHFDAHSSAAYSLRMEDKAGIFEGFSP